MNTTEGRILPVLANAIAAFRHAPEWGGVLAFNEFGFGTVALKPAPWGIVSKGEWTDQEDRLAAEWLQQQGILVSVEIAGQAVQTAARDHPFHPVRTYLKRLQWDGVKRLDRWLSTYLGSEDTEYSRAVGSRWLISAVARIFRPGAKADCCLILEGAQGIRKSTPLRTLAGEYFTDELADLGSKDAAMQTRGVWIIELSELHSLSNSDVARIKAFMSRTTDRFRPPYGMRLVESPRQCVFAGTANQSTYLRDETGGRRFWPVACGRIDIDALACDRDQLCAEAKGRFDAGVAWWLETNELAQMASDQQMDRL
jgi:predicted P-loop ATPase